MIAMQHTVVVSENPWIILGAVVAMVVTMIGGIVAGMRYFNKHFARPLRAIVGVPAEDALDGRGVKALPAQVADHADEIAKIKERQATMDETLIDIRASAREIAADIKSVTKTLETHALDDATRFKEMRLFIEDVGDKQKRYQTDLVGLGAKRFTDREEGDVLVHSDDDPMGIRHDHSHD